MTDQPTQPDNPVDIVTRLITLYPDRLYRLPKGGVRSRRATKPVSQSFAAKLVAAGVGTEKEVTRAKLRRMLRNAGPIENDRAASLGLDLPKPPRRLVADRAVARLGYDFASADAVVDLMRQAKIAPVEGGRYLQLGSRCGHAIRTFQLALPGTHWTGLDSDPEAVAWANEYIAGAKFAALPATPTLPDADGSFDGAVVLEPQGLGSVADFKAWIAELHRVVRPGGLLVVATPGVGTLADASASGNGLREELEQAYQNLEQGREAEIAVGESRLTLFPEGRFREHILGNGWQPCLSLLAGGPDASDAHAVLRLSENGELVGVAAPPIVAQTGLSAPQRFVVLAMQRTGSNMVVASLNTHPSVYCHGELLRADVARLSALDRALEQVDPKFREDAYRAKHTPEFIEAVFGLRYGAEFVGFKYILSQAPWFRREFLDDTRYAKVLLTRDNVLARYASNKAAAASHKPSERPGQVAFDPEEFERFQRQHDALYGEARERLRASDKSYLEIPYVEAATPAGMRAILAAIGADPEIDLGVTTPKRSTYDIMGRFSNPALVEAFLDKQGLNEWRQEKLEAAVDTTPPAPSGDAEIDFVATLLAQRAGATELARRVLVHGKDPEIRRLAQETVAGHRADLNRLKGQLTMLQQGRNVAA